MQAKERLLLTADRKSLVRDGDPEGVELYCTPGNEIPESAAKLFGLIDGRLPDGAALVVDIVEGGFLRVRFVRAFELNTPELHVGGLAFTDQFRTIGAGEIDEGQLLAILKEADLDVEAALIGDPSPGWLPFPGRDKAVIALQERIDDDIAAGRPHMLVGDDTAEKVQLLAALSVKDAPPPPNKERAPGQDKEKTPDGDKGVGGGTKGAAVALFADDLTQVKFVGTKVADGFAKAGITTFAQIAAVDIASPPAVEGTRATTNWAGIVASAKEIVAKVSGDVSQGEGSASGDGGAETGDAGQGN